MSPRVVVAAAIMLAVLAIAPSWKRGFHGGDDFTWVDEVGDRSTVIDIFDPQPLHHGSYRDAYYVPVQSLIFRAFVDPETGPHTVWLLRVLLCALHVVNVVLVYRLLRYGMRLQGPGMDRIREEGAALGAALFAIHPVNVQVVWWIAAAVGHVIATTCILAACGCWIAAAGSTRGPMRRGWQAGAWGCALVACLTRETGAMIAAVLMALSFALKRRQPSSAPGQRALLPFFALTLAAIGFQAYLYPSGPIADQWGGFRLGSWPLRVFEIQSILVYPFALSATARAALAIGVAAALAWFATRKHAGRMPGFLVLIALIVTLPYSIANFHPAELVRRYAYLPSAVLLPCLALVPSTLADRWRHRVLFAGYAIAATLAAASLAWSWSR